MQAGRLKLANESPPNLINEIPDAILGFVKTQPKVTIPPLDENVEEKTRRHLLSIFAQLRIRTGRDFTHYKRTTILRRIARRMQFHRVEDLELYLEFLHQHPDEVRKLADDLLVTVTNFFRDREVFQMLEKSVIPELFAKQRTDDAVRLGLSAARRVKKLTRLPSCCSKR